MVKFEVGLEINKPVEEIFAYLADPRKETEYSGVTQEVRVEGSGPIGKGTKYFQTAKFMGKRLDSLIEITEYEPNRRVTYRGVSGPMPMTWTYQLEPVGRGTRVSMNGEAEPSGFFKLASPVMQGPMKKQAETELRNLKELLEDQRRITR